MLNLKRKLIENQPVQTFIDLPTLLQQEARQKKSGRLRIMGPNEQFVDIYLETGQVSQVALNGRPVKSAEKTFCNMFRWAHWSPWFSAGISPPVALASRRCESMEGLVLRAAKEEDDSCRYHDSEPPHETAKSSAETKLEQIESALGYIARFSEIDGWMLCDPAGAMVADDGLGSRKERFAACLVHLASTIQKVSEPLQLGDFVYASVTLGGRNLAVLPLRDYLLGFRLTAGAEPLPTAQRVATLLDMLPGATSSDEAGHSERWPHSLGNDTLPTDSRLAAILAPLHESSLVEGLLVTDGRGRDRASTLGVSKEVIGRLASSLCRSLRELRTVWRQIGDLSFVFAHEKKLLLKNLDGHGCLAILGRAGTNSVLLGMPAEVAREELIAMFSGEPGSPQAPKIELDPLQVREAARKLAMAFPDIEQGVRRFEAFLDTSHDRAAWMRGLGHELGQILIETKRLSSTSLEKAKRASGSLDDAIHDVIWPLLSTYSIGLGSAGKRRIQLISSAFCSAHEEAESPRGDFVRGLIEGLLEQMDLTQVEVVETRCQAMGHEACTFEISPDDVPARGDHDR